MSLPPEFKPDHIDDDEGVVAEGGYENVPGEQIIENCVAGAELFEEARQAVMKGDDNGSKFMEAITQVVAQQTADICKGSETRVGAVEGDVTTMQKDLGKVTNKVDEVTAKVDELNDKVASSLATLADDLEAMMKTETGAALVGFKEKLSVEMASFLSDLEKNSTECFTKIGSNQEQELDNHVKERRKSLDEHIEAKKAQAIDDVQTQEEAVALRVKERRKSLERYARARRESLDGQYEKACHDLEAKKAQAVDAVQTQEKESTQTIQNAIALLRNQGNVADLDDDDKKKADTCINDHGAVIVYDWSGTITINRGKDKVGLIIKKGNTGKFAFSFTPGGKPRFYFDTLPGVSKTVPWWKIKVIPSNPEASDESDNLD